MEVFQKYLSGFEEILSKRSVVDQDILENQSNLLKSLAKSRSSVRQLSEGTLPAKIEGPKVLIPYDREQLEQFFGKNPYSFDEITVGGHPDFKDLPINKTLLHHCTSVFIDIKGSTKLINKYSLLEIRLIKDSLLTLAILLANQFGGHVHRLQGDGIFLQFVRKNNKPNDAIINALNMTSVLTNFVANELAAIMEKYGISPIKIRAGIDFGEDEKVLWSYYGIPGCNELTTTSLHTDMAAKLQAIAKNNMILIGNNVYKTLDMRGDYIDNLQTENGTQRVYKINNELSYPFFVFKWKEYLTLFPFFSNNIKNPQILTDTNGFSLLCELYDEGTSNYITYYPNSYSIPKGKQIRYNLLLDNLTYIPGSGVTIEWEADNSGKQAEIDKQSHHDFGKKFNNTNECLTSAAYLGHHLLICKIKRPNKSDVELKFPIFVQ